MPSVAGKTRQTPAHAPTAPPAARGGVPVHKGRGCARRTAQQTPRARSAGLRPRGACACQCSSAEGVVGGAAGAHGGGAGRRDAAEATGVRRSALCWPRNARVRPLSTNRRPQRLRVRAWVPPVRAQPLTIPMTPSVCSSLSLSVTRRGLLGGRAALPAGAGGHAARGGGGQPQARGGGHARGAGEGTAYALGSAAGARVRV